MVPGITRSGTAGVVVGGADSPGGATTAVPLGCRDLAQRLGKRDDVRQRGTGRRLHDHPVAGGLLPHHRLGGGDARAFRQGLHGRVAITSSNDDGPDRVTHHPERKVLGSTCEDPGGEDRPVLTTEARVPQVPRARVGNPFGDDLETRRERTERHARTAKRIDSEGRCDHCLTSRIQRRDHLADHLPRRPWRQLGLRRVGVGRDVEHELPGSPAVGELLDVEVLDVAGGVHPDGLGGPPSDHHLVDVAAARLRTGQHHGRDVVRTDLRPADEARCGQPGPRHLALRSRGRGPRRARRLPRRRRATASGPRSTGGAGGRRRRRRRCRRGPARPPRRRAPPNA